MLRKYGYLIFALLILVMNGELQKNEAVVAAPVIPEEAIRLRILANSDTAEDQWLKREIRDEIIAYMQSLTAKMDNIDTARHLIMERLPDIERRIRRLMTAHGFRYDVDVDYGQVPFPTKLYGNHVYPAGDYEAVRISIGEASGANWWCVLFPPLCFVDMTNADAVSAGEQEEADAEHEPPEGEDERQMVDETEPPEDDDEDDEDDKDDEVEVRFFLVDWYHNVMAKLKGEQA